MRITSEMLHEADACTDQVAVFAAEWSKGCEVTLETIQRAVELGLNVEWAARHFLSPQLWAEYERQVARFWPRYEHQTARVIWSLIADA